MYHKSFCCGEVKTKKDAGKIDIFFIVC